MASTLIRSLHFQMLRSSVSLVFLSPWLCLFLSNFQMYFASDVTDDTNLRGHVEYRKYKIILKNCKKKTFYRRCWRLKYRSSPYTERFLHSPCRGLGLYRKHSWQRRLITYPHICKNWTIALIWPLWFNL